MQRNLQIAVGQMLFESGVVADKLNIPRLVCREVQQSLPNEAVGKVIPVFHPLERCHYRREDFDRLSRR